MSTFTPPALHGIIGYPLGHSMSPLMHNTAFRDIEPARRLSFMAH